MLKPPATDINVEFLQGNLPFMFRLAQLRAQRLIREIAGGGDYDLTSLEMSVLIMGNDNPGISQKRLAYCLGAPQSVLVAGTKKLEGLNLIEKRKSAQDRRQFEIRTTRDGRRHAETLRLQSQQVHQRLTVAMSEAECDLLTSLLTKMTCSNQILDDFHSELLTEKLV